jgi:O-antigen ligase
MQQLIYWALIGVVCLSPLPLASNRPLPWSVLALSVGVLLLAWGVMRLMEPQLEAAAERRRRAEDAADEGIDKKHRRRRRKRHSGFDAGEWPLAKYSMVFILGFTLLCGWYWLQTSRLSFPMAHPAWAEAASSLGESLTGVISIEPAAGLTLLMKIMSYGGIFIMALYFGRDRHRARTMFIAVAISSAAYATYGLVEHFGRFDKILWFPKTEYAGNVTSSFINRNSYATYAGIGILASLGPILQELRRLTIGRITALRLVQSMSEEGTAVFYLLLTSVMLNLAALVLTNSRAGFASTSFGIFIFLVMVLALRDIGLRHFIALLVFAVSVVFAFVAIGGANLIDRMQGEGKEARVDLFDVGRLAASERPLTGQGLASFSAAFNRANDGNALFETAWVDFAHNSYLELAVEGGMIGLIGSLALVGLMVGLMLQGVFQRARGTSFVVTGLACCALVGAHAIVDFSIQMPAVAATFLFLVGAASGQALPSEQSSNRTERLAREAEEDAEIRRLEREEAKAKKERRKRRKRRRSESDEPEVDMPEPAMARADADESEGGRSRSRRARSERSSSRSSRSESERSRSDRVESEHRPPPSVAENLRRMAAELGTAQTEPEPSSSRRKGELPQPAFGTDYGSALERWRQLRAASAIASPTLVSDAPSEPHPDDRVLVEQDYIRTSDPPPPPQPAFDPTLSQPPTPSAWPGADTVVPAEPDDVGLPPPPEDDPAKPSAKIYELPRNRGR